MLIKVANQDGDDRWIDPESVRLVLDRFDEVSRSNFTILVIQDVGEIWTSEPLDYVVTRINKELR